MIVCEHGVVVKTKGFLPVETEKLNPTDHPTYTRI